MPMIPLITIDPYFSVWCKDRLNGEVSQHWTNSPNTILGTVTVDGETFCFWGKTDDIPYMDQTVVDIDAMSTTFVFENEKIQLTAKFTSPLLVTDLYLCSRPVAYLRLSCRVKDAREHQVFVKISVTEELVLNKAGEGRALSRGVDLDGLSAICMGNGVQNVLWRSGDNVRIDWGYFYLAVKGDGTVGDEVLDGKYAVYAETALHDEALYLFAYDDIDSLLYFNTPLKAYYKKDGKTVEQALSAAAKDYSEVERACDGFSEQLYSDACDKGGEKYAELLTLAYRQVMAGHKLALDHEGNCIYVSKECFSNGCGATLDITYPSAPMYLYYNTELLKGMLRPIFRYAQSDQWTFDFAPHDVGQYPLLNGQVYCNNRPEGQMPLEECGNILILVSAICRKEHSYDFAKQHIELLTRWNDYLVRYGEDPLNQLCTDDFAGHMPHNCNLSVKAVMGIIGFADVLKNLGKTREATDMEKLARGYAASFMKRAANADGSFRLAYDRPDTFSLKYNCVWDRLWNTNLFDKAFYRGEISRYIKESDTFGVPLDSRAKYSKSDWQLWAACMTDQKEEFALFVNKLWKAYDTMHSRVPMTDWYYTDNSEQVGFQNRTVQGGLFIRLLMD